MEINQIKCPYCGKINVATTTKCNCGYYFDKSQYKETESYVNNMIKECPHCLFEVLFGDDLICPNCKNHFNDVPTRIKENTLLNKKNQEMELDNQNKKEQEENELKAILDIETPKDIELKKWWKSLSRKDRKHYSQQIKAKINFLGFFSPDDNQIKEMFEIHKTYCYNNKKALFQKNQDIRKRSGNFIDERDNHIYRTIKIGNQIWMAENLAYLPHVCYSIEEGGIWVAAYEGNNITDAKATDNYKAFGCLYDWETARKIAPRGWCLPTKEDFELLLKNVSITGIDAYKNLIAGGASGFDALFCTVRECGIRGGPGFYFLDGTCFWSESHHKNFLGALNSWSLIIGGAYYSAYMADKIFNKWGIPVRCIKKD